VTLDVVSVKSEVGFGYYVSDGLEAYCSGDIKWSSMVNDMYGNIGLRYSFGKLVNKNIIKAELGGGIGFIGDGRRFRWNVSCGIDFMLAGKNEEITSKFKGGNSLPGSIANQSYQR
jgi:hypothetical protein